MKTPIIKYNDKFLDSLSWFGRIGGITFWPYVILREKYNTHPHYIRLSKRIIRHESIHTKQQEEMLVLPFYVWYVIEWFIKIFIYGSLNKAYLKISFEQEAKKNERKPTYLKKRKHFSWLKFIFR